MRKFVQPMFLVAAAASLAMAQQPPQAQVKATKGGISKAEADAFNAIMKAQTPDEKIKAADEFVTKFADSQYKGIALYDAAEAADDAPDFSQRIRASLPSPQP